MKHHGRIKTEGSLIVKALAMHRAFPRGTKRESYRQAFSGIISFPASHSYQRVMVNVKLPEL